MSDNFDRKVCNNNNNNNNLLHLYSAFLGTQSTLHGGGESPQPLPFLMDYNQSKIQNIFLCVQQNKHIHTGLALLEGE